MPLRSGDRLGPYEILGAIGAGGMGEVYRGRDPRLGREVAIKILPVAFATDPDRLRRFELEARAAGQLNHPNILTVHDTGRADGSSYLVSELLEGETLRARLSKGRLSANTALDYALQIARGLQAAHAKGMVHRDLKPENLFVTTDGRVKILDFGLAKLTTPASYGPAADTAALERTEPGVVMGTAGYMSPEQVRAEPVDHRADIFAFGAIFYEMLSGARAFPGTSSVDVMGAVLRHDVPDATGASPTLSPALARIVRHCLEKVPSARFQSTADLSFAIEALSPAGAPTSGVAPVKAASGMAAPAGWIATSMLAVALAALAIVHFLRPAADTRVFSASVLPPHKSIFGSVVVSPDGRWLAFTDTSAGGKEQLWIRTLDGAVVSTQALAGTTGASNPFWSPDARSLGFFADGHLKVIDIAGGLPRTLTEVGDNRGGTWNRDGVILFSRDLAGPLFKILVEASGEAQAVTQLRQDEGTHRWPHFLPDGRHFLDFVRSTDPALVGTYVASLDNPSGTRLLATSTNAIYAAPGFLLFVRDGTLMAQRFDAGGVRLVGDAASLIPKVGYSMSLNHGTFSASADGVLVYGGNEDRQAVWFDRAGTAQGAVTEPDSYSNVALSPNDDHVVIERPDRQTGANDIALVDLRRRNVATRFTTHPASDSRAIWVPTSNLIVWASNRTRRYDLYRKPALGAGEEELLFSSSESKFVTGSTADGRFVLFESEAPQAKSTMWALPAGGSEPIKVLGSGFSEAQARVSPDGRWIAFTSDKDGTFDIYLAETGRGLTSGGRASSGRSAGASSSIRISTGGGTQPLWRRDGKKTELYYLAPDRRLMGVPFDNAGRVGASAPEVLFETRVVDVGHSYQNYAASRDGQRFLILVRVEDTAAATVVLNWTSILSAPVK